MTLINMDMRTVSFLVWYVCLIILIVSIIVHVLWYNRKNNNLIIASSSKQLWPWIAILVMVFLWWYILWYQLNVLPPIQILTRLSQEQHQYIKDSEILAVNNNEKYVVSEVIDGDTIKIDINWLMQSVRLIGIDAPENSTLRYGHTECYGTESKQYLSEIILNKEIILEFDETQDRVDKYDRILAYVWLEGENVNELMVKWWFANEYTYNNPYKYQSLFKSAETSAKTGKLWMRSDDCNIINKALIVPSNNALLNINTTYTCGSKRYCNQMNNCEEAYFYYTQCWLSRLDGDSDGIPCETLCWN